MISIATQAIIPRGLGPKAYGDFTFLTNFFTQFTSLLDMGTSTCFYTKLSVRPKETRLVSFYLSYFMGSVFILVVLFMLLAHLSRGYTLIWPEQKIFFIYMAAIWGILTLGSGILNQMVDAYGLTVPSEKARIIQKILGLVIVLILFLSNGLYLTQVFLYQYLILLFLVVGFVFIIKKNDYPFLDNRALSKSEVKGYLKEFYHYSHPLFIYSLIGFVANIFDRWLLQVFGGGVQQGFYGLSYNIGAICFLFTGAMTPLLMREFSIAYGKNDIPKMANLFNRYIPIFYTISAFFSCFVAIQADKVISIMGGQKFNEALMPVVIMAFYPIFQTYGQLCGSVFFATGQTSIYRNVGILFLLAGLPLTYFLIAPTEKFGINAGAAGLALKMVLIQFVGVNVMLYFSVRLLHLSFKKFFILQLSCVGCLMVLAASSALCVDFLFKLHGYSFLSFIFAGIIYSILTMIMAYFFPRIFGLREEDIHLVYKTFLEKLRI
jgi:O-antigen/teichoic acid export membrane protein